MQTTRRSFLHRLLSSLAALPLVGARFPTPPTDPDRIDIDWNTADILGGIADFKYEVPHGADAQLVDYSAFRYAGCHDGKTLYLSYSDAQGEFRAVMIPIRDVIAYGLALHAQQQQDI